MSECAEQQENEGKTNTKIAQTDENEAAALRLSSFSSASVGTELRFTADAAAGAGAADFACAAGFCASAGLAGGELL